MTLYIGMRSADAAELFDRLAAAARAADGRDGAFEERVSAVHGASEIVFTNDDMERDEMTGKTVVDWSDSR